MTILTLQLAWLAGAAALDNGVASLPRMGWSNFNFFGGRHFDETLARQIADALVASGLRDLGFNYLELDNGALNRSRDAHGRLQANRTLFPSGLRALSDYLAARKLKLGLYTDIGNVTCGGMQPGSYGHYDIDANTFAHEWNANGLKVDFCDFWFIPEQLGMWSALRDALNRTGRPMWLYTSPHCGGPHSKVPATGVSAPWRAFHPYAPPLAWSAPTIRGLANSMMVQYVNLFDEWYTPRWKPGGPPAGFLTNVDAMAQLGRDGALASGPGFFPDAQQLEVCNFGEAPHRQCIGMTLEEYRAQYSLWALFASPLVLTFDVRTIRERHPECFEMVVNRELLAIARDPLGRGARLVAQATNLSAGTPASATRTSNIIEQVWSRPLANGDVAVGLFNRAETSRNLSVSWADVGLAPQPAARRVRDVWRHNGHGGDTGVHAGGFQTTVPPHAIRLLRVAGGTERGV